MRPRLLLALPLLLAPALAQADDVYLTDGSRLVGTVEQLAYDKLKLKTEFAGEIVLPAAKVKGVSTKTPLAVQLKNGERAVGPLDYSPDAGQKVGGENPRKIDLGQVTAMWPAGTDSPDEAMQKAKALAAGWQLHLELGINGQTGNSEITNINGAAEVKRETDSDRFSLYAKGLYSHQDGKDTARDIIGGSKLESNLTKDFYWFIQGELENDEFQHLDIRATVVGGLGYFLIHDPDQEFKIHAGPGYEHDSFDNGVTRDDAVIELGEHYRKNITSWLTFVHDLNYYPTFDSISLFRVTMENSGEIPLTPDKVWRFKIGVRNQYESQPEAGAKRLDTWYYLNLVMDIK